MIALFKKNETVQAVIIVILTLVLLAGHGVQLLSGPPSSSIAPQGGWIPQLSSPLLSVALAFLVIVGEGFWLNCQLVKSKVVPSGTLLPMLIYILVMAAQGPFQLWSPMLIVNLLMLAVLQCTLVSTDRPSLSDQALFTVSLLCALATIALPSTWIVVFYMLVVLTRFQLYTWRHWVLVILGFLAPYFPWLLIHFLSDSLPQALASYGSQVAAFRIAVAQPTALGWVENIFFIACLVGGTLYGLSLRDNRTEVGNLNNALLIYLLCIGVALLFYESLFPVCQPTFAIPFAYVVSLVFLNVSKGWFWHLLFLLFVILMVVSSFNTL